MRKIIERGHAIRIPASELRSDLGNTVSTNPNQEEKSQDNAPLLGQVWYLPHFGVYHPRKPSQIRVVFDSSAEFKGTSLNKELLPGQDLMNSLIGVLFRFRHHEVGVMADMNKCFTRSMWTLNTEISCVSCGLRTTIRPRRSWSTA